MEEKIIPPAERINRELDLETLAAPLDLAEIFGNDNPLELEIGIGKGLFLLNEARRNPDRNYIGIEIARKYLVKARERVEKRGVPNVRFVNGEAFDFMEKFLSDESLSTIHIYFPDPWPKKRHHKRRLFSDVFIPLAHRKLKPGGLMLIATDHAGYWEWMCEVLEKQTLLVHADRMPEAPDGTAGLTNYEIKYQKEGRTIFRTGYRKP
ncbi:MAG: tRNA (guanosine(46)-N7)-methyltransferase TrmB [Acidobacteriota bacterium]|nr:tRNA (guanosine(46)-N7)-methyltransferase TrmB [Acidobacteriota bacterium]